MSVKTGEVQKDNFERDFKKTEAKSFPPKFKKQWDEEIVGVEQTFDLQTMINRLPVYLRDSMPLPDYENKKPKSKKGPNPTLVKRNKDIHKDYNKMLEKGKSDYAAMAFLSKKHSLEIRTIKDILYKSLN